ncbi:ABC transporter substrate-binding protein [Pseudomonas kuykendallii]|uniref:Dipeptide transport system substrate-binding protein n=1 Tax=Pseudomonas kuykendallii TaxID=1007099 RepID=A0A1H2WQS4_9PSED|nr:ABC transporter substrate-binding protein [Pseudomonas kuykendallii]MCQ4270726.1 ABC transporter substrate-binding protein [Pseudomonas kuykendallii]SDW82982.1 dipeptide transport system substrate-binding protein [Pseudomonas kuykendallii]
MSPRRRSRAALFVVCLLGAAAGAAASAAPSSLVVCSEASPEGFDIVQYTAAVTADASAETLFDRLIRFVPGSTELEPGLAQSWQVSDDGLSYTLQLRRGVKFHRSKTFTPSRDFNADDVLWSFQRQLDPQHPWHALSPRGFPYFESMALGELIERIEKLDDYQVRFVLRHPEAPFLADLAMGFASIYSAEYAAQLLAAGTPEKLNSEPIGTGPFIFERYAKDAQIRFRGNPDYWDGAPPMDRLIFAITPDPNVRQQKLKAGDCQIAVYPRPTDIAQLKSEPDLKVLELDSLMVAYIALNVRHPPLDDPRVRQAINLAFDKPAYLRAQFGEGNASPAVAPYPPTLWGQDETLAGWPYDPQRARQLLADSGHADGFRLSIWTRPGGGPTNPNPGIGAQMLQADLAAIGVQAEVRVFEWGELIKRAKNGEHDLVFMGWSGDNGDPDNFLTPNLSCAAAKSGENQAGWCNAEFDALIARARGLSDQAQRAALYRQALGIFTQQAPWLPLAYPKQFAVQRGDVQGFVLSPLGSNNYAKVRYAP